VFISLDPSLEAKVVLKNTITKLDTFLDTGIKWVDFSGIHLTLKFLGNIPSKDKYPLLECVKSASQQFSETPFSLSLGQLGVFPKPSEPSVIWAGVSGDLDKLHGLHGLVQTAIDSIGYPADKRAYNPHMTIGRVRRNIRQPILDYIGKTILETSIPESKSWIVSHIHIMESSLSPEGAKYSSIARAVIRA
jgi:2'-5' RNA ligase